MSPTYLWWTDKGCDRKQHRASSAQTKDWLTQLNWGCTQTGDGSLETKFWKSSISLLPGGKRGKKKRVFLGEYDHYTQLESEVFWGKEKMASVLETTEYSGVGLGADWR